MQTPDYQFWTEDKRLWTLIEAACLIAGIEPQPLEVFDMKITTGGLAAKIYDALKDAIDLKGIDFFETRTSALAHRRVKPNCVTSWAKSRGYSIPAELISLLQPTKADKTQTPGERSETTYLNIIGGLLSLMLSEPSAGKPRSTFNNQSTIISALLEHYRNKPGISQRTLEDKFAAAKRSLNDI